MILDKKKRDVFTVFQQTSAEYYLNYAKHELHKLTKS